MSQPRIPGQIFMLWDNPRGARPPVVDLCIPLWKELNPTWNVFVLDGAEMTDLLRKDLSAEVLEPMSIQTKSDLLRLKLLSERGGVWADATCLPLAPMFKWFYKVADLDFSAPGFMHLQKPDPDPVRGRDYGTWFMASKKDGYVASHLYQRMLEFFHKPRYPIPQIAPLMHHVERNWRQFVGAEGDALSLSPYYTIHYMTALEIERNPKFRSYIVQSAIPVCVWNYVMSRMARVGSPQEHPNDLQEVLRFARRAPAPFNKLDWKVDCAPPWHKVRDILMEKRPAQSGTAEEPKPDAKEASSSPLQFLSGFQRRLKGSIVGSEETDTY